MHQDLIHTCGNSGVWIPLKIKMKETENILKILKHMVRYWTSSLLICTWINPIWNFSLLKFQWTLCGLDVALPLRIDGGTLSGCCENLYGGH